jgi:dephospho-CoA kinase
VENNSFLIAFVGMPGSGKTEATAYLHSKGVPFVRFGDITDEGLKAKGLPMNPQNEQEFREAIRKELGMAAYAIKSEPKISEAIKTHPVVALDGLYSWGEYRFLHDKFSQLRLIHVYATPQLRYKRLQVRPIRPIEPDMARIRDIAEIEHLDKGGPIAIADFMIENDTDHLDDLHDKIDRLFVEIGITI